jgi:hypothetical protein
VSQPKDNGRYSIVSRRMWNDEGFRALSAPPPNGQTLFQRLLTGPELTNIPGVIPAFDAGMARALKWPLEGFLKAFQEVSDQGMAKADWEAGLIWVPNAIRHNVPGNPNIVLSWQTAWEEVPECDLKLEAWEGLSEFLKTKKDAWLEAFERACRKPSRKGLPKDPPLLPPKPEQVDAGPFGESDPGTGTGTGTGTEEASDRRAGLDADSEVVELVQEAKAKQERERLRAQVRDVFERWRQDTGHYKATLDDKRGRRIAARLREGFTPDELALAITHRRNDPWLMGETERSTRVYDDIETLLRDRAQVERLIRLIAPHKPKVTARGSGSVLQASHGMTGTEKARRI